MKLTFDQIRSVTVGAVRTWETDAGFHFARCTEKQIKAWQALEPILGERAAATTGVRLDFHTNSKHLSFLAVSGKKFEIYINNVLRYQIMATDENRSTPFTFDLNDTLGNETDTVRVTLYLPSHAIGVLKNVELDDGAAFIPHTFDRKLLMIGDSITQGWDSKCDSFSYALRTSRFFNAESVIYGVGGGFYHESTMDSIDFEPDVVTIAFGANDFGHYPTLDAMDEQVGKVMDFLAREYAEKTIFVISPIWRETQKKAMGTFAQCRQVVIDQAEKHGFIHIDGLSLVPPMPRFFADGNLHPDDLGFSLYAENLCRQMLPYLK